MLPLQERDVEAVQRNHGQNGGISAAEEGIVTVVSATEAAAARAGAEVADKAGDNERAARLQCRADRAARGEADHNLTGILLYALSTVGGLHWPHAEMDLRVECHATVPRWLSCLHCQASSPESVSVGADAP